MKKKFLLIALVSMYCLHLQGAEGDRGPGRGEPEPKRVCIKEGPEGQDLQSLEVLASAAAAATPATTIPVPSLSTTCVFLNDSAMSVGGGEIRDERTEVHVCILECGHCITETIRRDTGPKNIENSRALHLKQCKVKQCEGSGLERSFTVELKPCSKPPFFGFECPFDPPCSYSIANSQNLSRHYNSHHFMPVVTTAVVMDVDSISSFLQDADAAIPSFSTSAMLPANDMSDFKKSGTTFINDNKGHRWATRFFFEEGSLSYIMTCPLCQMSFETTNADKRTRLRNLKESLQDHMKEKH